MFTKYWEELNDNTVLVCVLTLETFSGDLKSFPPDRVNPHGPPPDIASSLVAITGHSLHKAKVKEHVQWWI